MRGTNEIGGSCVELSTANTTILIDYGTPLQNINELLSIDKHLDGILISHPHQDHYGEIVNLNKSIPIYCGELSLNLINSVRVFTGHDKLTNRFYHFNAWKKFVIGDFIITPFLVDHSATDAYAFLIEADGEKILYSGDFRSNGRKTKLFDNMLSNKKLKNVDVLIMEGTMIQRSNGDFLDEQSVEDKVFETITNSKSVSFMIASSQNIDSLVSAYKACVKANKIFVVDIYTAWILEQIKKVSNRIVNLDFANVKVYKPTRYTGGSQYGKVQDNKDYFQNFKSKIFHKNNVITFNDIKENPSKYFIKCSFWYIKEILREIEQENANIIYSQWLGYLKEEFSDIKAVRLFEDLRESYNWIYAHTSGHADLDTLKAFSSAINPKVLIPIHTEDKESFKEHFENVLVLDDNEIYNLNRRGNIVTLKEKYEKLQTKIGTKKGFSSAISYKLNDTYLTFEMKDKKGKLRELDCWGLAFYKELNQAIDDDNFVNELKFKIKSKNHKHYHIESCKRRLSFLKQNNEVQICLYIDNQVVSLYSYDELMKIGKKEIIRNSINERSDDDIPGRLEKDFQSYLFGKGLKEKEIRTNERLALLGSDFIFSKDKSSVLFREFPTGSFNKTISKNTRTMPTEFIDLVTVNKYKELSLIELKVSDSKLDVISQALDYSLYFLVHSHSLKAVLEQEGLVYNEKNGFNTYIVNNYFHPRFNDIYKFYQPKDTKKYFKLVKTTLGLYE